MNILNSIHIAEIPADASRVVEIAKDLGTQQIGTLPIVSTLILVIMCIWLVKTFLAKIDKKDDVIVSVVNQYQASAAGVTEALNKVANTVDDNTDVLRNIKQGLKLSLATVLMCLSLLFTGCASTSAPNAQTLSTLVEVATYTGASIRLDTHPEERPAFVVAHIAIEKLISDKDYSPASLTAAMQGLKVREFKGSRGALIVTSAVILWDAYTPTITEIDSEAKVLPVLIAIERGLQQALSQSE